MFSINNSTIDHLIDSLGKGKWYIAINIGGDDYSLILKHCTDDTLWIVGCHSDEFCFVTNTNGDGSWNHINRETANAITKASICLVLEQGVYDGSTTTTTFVNPKYNWGLERYNRIIKEGNPALISIVL